MSIKFKALAPKEKVKWWVKIVLLFCKKQTVRYEFTGYVCIYKVWRNEVYIIERYFKSPIHPMCRCTMTKP